VKPFARLLLRLAYSVAIRCGLIRSLHSFFPLWAASDAIYIGPAGPSAIVYPELLALQQVVASVAVPDEELFAHLSHRSPLVAGYCFEALFARRSSLLAVLPGNFLTRSELVSMGFTCFRQFTPLCDYIKRRLPAQYRDSAATNVA
jgi:hypothetical protein